MSSTAMNRFSKALAIGALVLLVLALLRFTTASLSAQDCTTGIHGQFMVGGPLGSGVVMGPIVPPDQVWVVDTVGIPVGAIYPVGSEWMLEVLTPVPPAVDSTDPRTCCWMLPMAKQLGSIATPVLGWTGRQVLRPGQRLRGRTNVGGLSCLDNTGQPTLCTLSLGGEYWQFPALCAGQLAAR